MTLFLCLSLQVANAVGAALSQVSGTEDVVQSLQDQSREEVIEQVKHASKQAAVRAGANPDKTEVFTHPACVVVASNAVFSTNVYIESIFPFSFGR